MAPRLKRERIDHLIDHLWQQGYLTLSRKFGKYLPAPPTICGYEVDSISKYKKKIAIGIVLSEDDLNELNFLSKLESIVSHGQINPANKFTVFIGISNKLLVKATMLISTLKEETQRHIKVIPLPDKN